MLCKAWGNFQWEVTWKYGCKIMKGMFYTEQFVCYHPYIVSHLYPASAVTWYWREKGSIKSISIKWKSRRSNYTSSYTVRFYPNSNTILCMCKVSQLEILNSFGNCSSCWMVTDLQQFQSSTKLFVMNERHTLSIISFSFTTVSTLLFHLCHLRKEVLVHWI